MELIHAAVGIVVLYLVFGVVTKTTKWIFRLALCFIVITIILQVIESPDNSVDLHQEIDAAVVMDTVQDGKNAITGDFVLEVPNETLEENVSVEPEML